MADRAEIAALIRQLAESRGVSPLDLATSMSFETGGTFDPGIKGPTTKWGQHRGLMQLGEAQRQRYGVTDDTPLPQQFDAFGRYLDDAGVKPGHGLMDIYSAINAGRLGRYGASDTAAGGTWGTVADKVNSQMAGHRIKAEALLGGGQAPDITQASMPLSLSPAAPAVAAPPTLAGAASVADTAAGDPQYAAFAKAMSALSQPAQPLQAAEIKFPVPAGLKRARELAAIMVKQAIGSSAGGTAYG